MTLSDKCDKTVGMKLTEQEYEKIAVHFPRQRGNVKHENLKTLNAILYVTENGCKWRSLAKEFGNWNSIYKKVNRWAKSGVLERVFIALQKDQTIRIKIEHVSLDSTGIKTHPDAHGALKKAGSNLLEKAAADGTQSFMWLPQLIKSR